MIMNDNLDNNQNEPVSPEAEKAAPNAAPAGVPAGTGLNPPQTPPPGIPAPPAYQPYYYAPVKTKPEVRIDRHDSVYSLLALLTGFLFCEFILFAGGLGVGVPLFFIAAYAGVIFYGLKTKTAELKRGAALFVPVGLLLACFVLFDNTVLGVLNLMLLFFLAVLQFMSMFGARDYDTLSKGLAFDFFNGFVARPVTNLDKLFVVTAKGAKASKGNRLFVRILIGVVICIPLLAVILSLLASADKAFEDVLDSFTKYISESFWEYLAKILLGIGLAVPLFGALYAFRYKTKTGPVKMPDLPRKLDRVVAYTVLSVVCAVYIFFLTVQFNYMFNAFRGLLPGDFIYSEYARRGFFELVAIAVINLGLLAVFYIFSGRKEGRLPAALKFFLIALSAITLVIIGSALSKMVMYMGVFGLTQLRVYTSWFMILTAVVFLAAVVKTLKVNFKVVRFIAVFFILWFLALNYAGTDSLIARYNIRQYESGESGELDVAMFGSLSDAVVPQLLQLTQSNDAYIQMEARSLLTEKYDRLDDQNWRQMNRESLKAAELLRENKADYLIDKGTGKDILSGTDVETLQKFLPKFKEVKRCEWHVRPTETYETAGNYCVFGSIVFSDAFYNEVVTVQYDWTIKFLDDSIAYFNEVGKDKELYENNWFTNEFQARDNYVSYNLDMKNKTLYFYYEENSFDYRAFD